MDTNLVQEALEKAKMIQEQLRAAQSMQKHYADQKLCHIVFMDNVKILLKVLPMKGLMKFRKKKKLSPRFIGMFEILVRIRVTYRLPLPHILLGLHALFYVFMLQKYNKDK